MSLDLFGAAVDSIVSELGIPAHREYRLANQRQDRRVYSTCPFGIYPGIYVHHLSKVPSMSVCTSRRPPMPDIAKIYSYNQNAMLAKSEEQRNRLKQKTEQAKSRKATRRSSQRSLLLRLLFLLFLLHLRQCLRSQRLHTTAWLLRKLRRLLTL